MTNSALALGRMCAVFPAWVPEAARNYLFHTEIGLSIRALARAEGCHASTVLRQVRRFEGRRDDPLVDAALRTLGERHFAHLTQHIRKGEFPMGVQVEIDNDSSVNDALDAECARVLRRLTESGAILAVAQEMEKSVVVREIGDGESLRTAVVDSEASEALALRGWIEVQGDPASRIARYRISPAGRTALKTLLAKAENAAQGLSGFADEDEVENRRKYALVESPLAGLARRRDKEGLPFLDETLVRAGERLREDFELARPEPKRVEEWLAYLAEGQGEPERPTGDPHLEPNVRLYDALLALGPGLGDVALRCCCLLEGMEQTERRMGWSARSGKIVLRIALQRLKGHYHEMFGAHGPMIY